VALKIHQRVVSLVSPSDEAKGRQLRARCTLEYFRGEQRRILGSLWIWTWDTVSVFSGGT
jgi:hypothetical protein